jgi:hypothetical protein
VSTNAKKLAAIQKVEEKLQIKKGLLINNALKSDSPTDILAARKVIDSIEQREHSEKKSYIVDPLDFNSNFGYRDKPIMLSYQTLKNMSKTPIINAIIKTRKNQIADFAEPQEDRYSTGFKIRKKIKVGETESDNTAEDWAEIEKIQSFILNCGKGESWEHDDFETFIRKIVDDSLTYDQMTFEIVRDNDGELFEFFATDASTFRIAESFDDDEYDGNIAKQIRGYYPKYVQIYQGSVNSEFYPWELCFASRNPSTSIDNNGYGTSELEELVSVVTSMLWAEDYNKKFFSQGAAPKGLLKIKGAVNPKQIDAFRQEWGATLTGVQNAWKTPVVEGDVEWIDLQKSNRDMEFSAWTDFLTKIACAIYNIDPNEIGFDINKSSGEKSMFESGNEGKLKHSKDKGLYPLLKFIQRRLNKYIVSQINPEYEIVFMGMNGLTITEELDADIKKLSNFMTVNETRSKYKQKPIEGGDVILNPTFTQSLAMKAQQQQMGTPQDGANPFTQDQMESEVNPFLEDGSEDLDDKENPFLKSFFTNLEK